jgi:hypothetical protein
MVELFTVGCFGRSPSVVIRPVACIAAHKLPTAAEVERTWTLSRFAEMAQVRTPWWD